MSLNDTVSAERTHIAFFGMRNAGKSSVVNAVTGQSISVVSDIKGTTTDPVKKTMEILPLGPVVIIDTPGFDDEGELGELRVQKTKEILSKTDIAVLVVDAVKGKSLQDEELINVFNGRKIPYITAFNKSDILDLIPETGENELYISAKTGENINLLKEKLAQFAKKAKTDKKIVADLINSGDTVILVIPIDESAPKGRIILPQQQVLRELLDKNCAALCVQTSGLKGALDVLNEPPALVITDSQAFKEVAEIVPESVPLTSFSILFARYKGEYALLMKGAGALKELKDGDKVLISEGCTHHRQCNDIGAVKLPAWIKKYSSAEPEFRFTSGGEFPEDLSEYALIVHCGGCMLNEAEMKSRLKRAEEQGIPIINYGMAIAGMNGILDRATKCFNI
ncbi:MAG: [FeFe] hydrogenase H-cluster maturation GTPase HydF [Oscillospiraceae bacterium]|nr:[FeFe] hydrogenase H-cluster maturation GTPase HydF [Oscillospiraceae bacterium]